MKKLPPHTILQNFLHCVVSTQLNSGVLFWCLHFYHRPFGVPSLLSFTEMEKIPGPNIVPFTKKMKTFVFAGSMKPDLSLTWGLQPKPPPQVFSAWVGVGLGKAVILLSPPCLSPGVPQIGRVFLTRDIPLMHLATARALAAGSSYFPECCWSQREVTLSEARHLPFPKNTESHHPVPRLGLPPPPKHSKIMFSLLLPRSRTFAPRQL